MRDAQIGHAEHCRQGPTAAPDNDGSGTKGRFLLKNRAVQNARPENQPGITYLLLRPSRTEADLLPLNRSRRADAPTVAAPIVRAPPVLD